MRVNLPVSQHEYAFPKGQTLVCTLLLVVASWCAALLGGHTLSLASGAAWLGVVVLALGMAVYLHQVTVAPLSQMLLWANRMAAGDLTQKISATRSDTVGQLQKALAQLNVNLLSIVRDARQESEHMQVSTREIAQGNQDLSSRTEAQASNLQQTAASMEEITGTVKQTAESARQASVLATQATQVAERSSSAVDGVADTMKQIQAASGRISEITQLIDSIAFQTNILALNAAVEAARAGDQGRGFAVVASEVRSLSHRTLSAAKEIRQLIDDSATKVTEGHEKTDAAQKTMAESLELVRRVNTLIGEIHSASNEQLSGISQVKATLNRSLAHRAPLLWGVCRVANPRDSYGYRCGLRLASHPKSGRAPLRGLIQRCLNSAVAQLDTITQQNAALVEENAASAMQLNGQAQTMTETVQVFRIDASAPTQSRDAVALRKEMKTSSSSRALAAA